MGQTAAVGASGSRRIGIRRAEGDLREPTASENARVYSEGIAFERRVELLFDEGTFVELGQAPARAREESATASDGQPLTKGIFTGYGTIDGRQVCLFSLGRAGLDQSLSDANSDKISKVMELAISTGSPLIGIYDSAGGLGQEDSPPFAPIGKLVRRTVKASGVVPQISLVAGPCAGRNVYLPALTDFTVMIAGSSSMFMTGPDLIRMVTGEDIATDELGGSHVQATRSGAAHYLGLDEEDAIDFVKSLLSFLPQNNLDDPPLYASGFEGNLEQDVSDLDRSLDVLVPDQENLPYDMRTVIDVVTDDEEFLEVQSPFAPNVVIGFGRIEGRPVGIVANQPMQLAGTLDIDASEKAARFVRTCDAFNIPVLTFVDAPGFLPGTDQEHSGVIRRSAKLIYAYAEASVPLITVITRKAYGAAYEVMASKDLGADVVFAWLNARIGTVLVPSTSAQERRNNKEVGAPARKQVGIDRAATQSDSLVDIDEAVERGYLDRIIAPHQTRIEVVRALRLLRSKRETFAPRKHGNMPL